MSRESAVAFYEQVEANEELQEKLKDLGTQKGIEEYVKEELGYHFSLEEMQKVIFEKNPEIADEDLEAVVGGTSSSNEASVLPVIVAGLVGGAMVGAGIIGVGAAAAAAAA